MAEKLLDSWLVYCVTEDSIAVEKKVFVTLKCILVSGQKPSVKVDLDIQRLGMGNTSTKILIPILEVLDT